MSVLFFIIPSVLIILGAWLAVKAVSKGADKNKAVLFQISQTTKVITAEYKTYIGTAVPSIVHSLPVIKVR